MAVTPTKPIHLLRFNREAKPGHIALFCGDRPAGASLRVTEVEDDQTCGLCTRRLAEHRRFQRDGASAHRWI